MLPEAGWGLVILLRRCFDWRTLHAAPDRGRRDNTKNNKRNRLKIVCLQNCIRRNTETTIQFRLVRGILTISYRDAVRDERWRVDAALSPSLSCRHCGLCADDTRLIVKEREKWRSNSRSGSTWARVFHLFWTKAAQVLVCWRQQQSVMATVGACEPLLLFANSIKATTLSILMVVEVRWLLFRWFDYQPLPSSRMPSGTVRWWW